MAYEGTTPTADGTVQTSAPDQTVRDQRASVIFVSYGIEKLDLDWIPEDAPVLVVHNDTLLEESACRPGCRHIYPGSNIGFGSGVNLALKDLETKRVIICNPDTALLSVHWDALAGGEENELVTVPVVDGNGTPKASAFRYPSPTILLLGITRAVQIAPAGTRRRKALAGVLGDWGSKRRWSVAQPPGHYPLATWWASGAVMSFDTGLLKNVGGFDASYFLYFEDTDLCRRIARDLPSANLLIADTPPALHRVGGSARTAADRKRVELERWQSARRYSATEKGLQWRLVGSLLSAGAMIHRLPAARPTLPNTPDH